jgi:histidine ammonia-lyase
MGWGAARKLRRAIDGLTRVLAIEVLTAARAADMRGAGTAALTGDVRAVLRERVAGPGDDRWLAPEIAAAVELVADRSLLAAARGGGSDFA